MGFPVAAAIAGGAAITGGVLNNMSTRRQNRESREFSWRMYNRQKADNIRFWNMQNSYNTPEAQMERLRAAGLNPNLIYGRGSASAGNADSIKTPDVKQAQFNAPDYSYLHNAANSVLNTYFDIEMKQAQIDNLRADNTVKQAEAALKLVSGKRGQFDLNFEKELRGYSAEARKEALRQLSTNTNYTLAKWELEALKNASDLKEAAVRIAKMRKSILKDNKEIKRMEAQIRLLEKDETLKQLEIELNRLGITKGDQLYERILGRYLNTLKIK